MYIFKQSIDFIICILIYFLILFVHVYVRKISHVHWEYIQGSPNTFIGEKIFVQLKFQIILYYLYLI